MTPYSWFSRDVRKKLSFIKIPSKRLQKDTGTQVNNSTFIFIADKPDKVFVFLRPCDYFNNGTRFDTGLHTSVGSQASL